VKGGIPLNGELVVMVSFIGDGFSNFLRKDWMASESSRVIAHRSVMSLRRLVSACSSSGVMVMVFMLLTR